MALYVREPGLGELLGSAFGTGVGAGLQSFGQARQLGKQQQAFAQMGLPAQLALLDPNIQREFIHQGLLQQQQAHKRMQQSQLFQQAFPTLPAPVADLLSQLEPQTQRAFLDRLEGLEIGSEQPIEEGIGAAPMELPETLEEERPILQGTPTEKVKEPAAQSVAKTKAIKLGPSSQERRHREIVEQKEKALREKQKAEAYKLTKEERKEILKNKKQAEEDIRDLNRFEELEKEGLPSPGYTEFLKRSGLDIPALTNPQGQEFQKIAQNFMRNAKTYLGARISNFELEQFLKTIPSLSQTPEGRKRVISNLKQIARSSIAYYDAMQEVLRENEGVPPLDLGEQIEEKVGNKLDKISEQFKKDLSQETPPEPSKFLTALQATAGDILGGIPGALKGAGKGALLGAGIGKTIGIPGTLTGAALGGLGGLLGIL